MFFKVKCPPFGVKNSKERMTCVECGDQLDLVPVKGQLSDVSRVKTIGEVGKNQDSQASSLKQKLTDDFKPAMRSGDRNRR